MNLERSLLVVALLAVTGCTSSKLEGAADWQNALLSQQVEVQWGASGTKYIELSPWTPVTGEDQAALRKLFATPVLEGALKCIVHIDGKLRAGDTEVRVCLGCGELFTGTKQYVFGPRHELRQLMTKVLGPRPREPSEAELFPGL